MAARMTSYKRPSAWSYLFAASLALSAACGGPIADEDPAVAAAQAGSNSAALLVPKYMDGDYLGHDPNTDTLNTNNISIAGFSLSGTAWGRAVKGSLNGSSLTFRDPVWPYPSYSGGGLTSVSLTAQRTIWTRSGSGAYVYYYPTEVTIPARIDAQPAATGIMGCEPGKSVTVKSSNPWPWTITVKSHTTGAAIASGTYEVLFTCPSTGLVIVEGPVDQATQWCTQSTPYGSFTWPCVALAAPVTDPEITAYKVSVYADGRWQPLCRGNALATAVGQVWNAYTGARGDRTGYFTFACLNGAIGKCADQFHYKPWKARNGASLAPYHQACIRAVRSDYFGNGPWTREGAGIEVWDDIGVNARQGGDYYYEGTWTEAGAACIMRYTWDYTSAAPPSGFERPAGACTSTPPLGQTTPPYCVYPGYYYTGLVHTARARGDVTADCSAEMDYRYRYGH